ncbi:MAG: hypothetical protein ACTSYB_11320 [Candidatus Helarchaeota archaeon]
MKFILRGTIAHILLKEDTVVSDIIQDIMLQAPKKYYLETHLDENNEVISLIIQNIGSDFERIIEVLEYFAKKYNKIKDPKYNSISNTFFELTKELRRTKPLSPRNLFRFDRE